MEARHVFSTAVRLALAALLLIGCAGPRPAPTASIAPVTGEPAQSVTEVLEAPASAPTAEPTEEPTAVPTEELTETPSPVPATATPEPTATEVPPASPLTLSSNPDNELLFYVTQEDSTRIYYYGVQESGTMALTHTILDDGSGDLYAVIYGPDLVPIQWILPAMTVAVYPQLTAKEALGEEPPAAEPYEGSDFVEGFNPHQAVHLAVGGGKEEAYVADILPRDLLPVVEGMEAVTGSTFSGARDFLGAYPQTYGELVELAGQAGPEQPRYIAAAAGFSAAEAALSLSETAGDLAAAPRVAGMAAPSRVIFGELIKLGAGALAGIIADELGESLDPGDGPSVGVLLCRGAAKYGICHYLFFQNNELGQCISFCRTSMRCFASICMPMDISAEMAMNLRNKF